MSIIWMLLIGLIVGAIAKFLLPGPDPGGMFVTMLLGIAGSILASFLGQRLGWYEPGAPAGFLMSIAGSILLLLLYRFTYKSTHA